jgi:hypothetical protein
MVASRFISSLAVLSSILFAGAYLGPVSAGFSSFLILLLIFFSVIAILQEAFQRDKSLVAYLLLSFISFTLLFFVTPPPL